MPSLSEQQSPNLLRVALDTSFAGINLTGVGKYSRMLGKHLGEMDGRGELDLRCYGPSCAPPNEKALLGGLYREWPTYTQVYLPLQLARFRPHVVHSTSHLGPLWGKGRPIVTVHDLIFRRFPSDYNASWLAITRLMLPRVLLRARAVLADSHTTRRDIEELYPQGRHKITVVYPGIDEAFRAPIADSLVAEVRKRLGVEHGRYVLCLGPWVRRKNLETVIAAFGRFAPDIPDAKLVLTGTGALGMQGAEVRGALAALPTALRDRVVTAGHVPSEQLPALVRGASVLAYPSLFEGFGLPPLEAMAAGVPAVTSDTPAVAEAVGDAAITVPARDIEEWAQALRGVLDSAGLAEEMRQKGLKRSAPLTWERCASDTLEVYRRVASSRRKRAAENL